MGWRSTEVGLNLGGGVKIVNHLICLLQSKRFERDSEIPRNSDFNKVQETDRDVYKRQHFTCTLYPTCQRYTFACIGKSELSASMTSDVYKRQAPHNANIGITLGYKF